MCIPSHWIQTGHAISGGLPCRSSTPLQRQSGKAFPTPPLPPFPHHFNFLFAPSNPKWSFMIQLSKACARGSIKSEQPNPVLDPHDNAVSSFQRTGWRLLRADRKWLEPLLACLLICLQTRAERRATIPQGKETLLLCMSCYQLRQAMQSVHKPWDRGCRNITLAPFPQLNFMFLFKFPCDL